jgi:lactate dehydrogenase-like 2-hydroxyacid dehydrogenase
MRKPVLVVTAYFIDAVESRLKQDFELRRKKNGARFTPEELLSAADGADAMFVTPADRLEAAFFTRVASSVKVIATHSVGYDHIDLKAAAARKIAIAYIPGISTDAVADITLLLLLGASRRAYEALPVVRSGSWNPLDLTLLLGWQLTGKILGIYGRRPEISNYGHEHSRIALSTAIKHGTHRTGGGKTRSGFWDEDPLPRSASLASRN